MQLLTGDSWSTVLYDSISSKDTVYAQFLVAIFIILWVIIAQLAILNLFVAAIIQNFDVSATIENIKKPGMIAATRNEIKRLWGILYAKLPARRKGRKRTRIVASPDDDPVFQEHDDTSSEDKFSLSTRFQTDTKSQDADEFRQERSGLPEDEGENTVSLR